MKEAVQTKKAPAAIGPYSQGICSKGAGGLLITAGQLGMDPETGQLVDGGIGPQCRRALENLKAVLEAGGSSLERVLKVTVFLASMEEFGQMNEVYETFFTAPYPARSAFGVAALPKGGRVEIEAIAEIG
jgi:2-iminobutanoate/2-iminopropanoate deaminase